MREYWHNLTATHFAFSQLYLFHSNYLWNENPDALDGVAATVTFTVAAGTTTTTINTVETMSDYVGSLAVINGLARLITGYTANSLTVSAFPSIPATGAAGYVGAINVRLTPEWMARPTLDKLKQPAYVLMEFEPAQANLFHQFSVGINFNSGYESYPFGAGDTPPSGLTPSADPTQWNVQSDGNSGLGIVPVPMPSRYDRCMRWRFQTWAPCQPFGLLMIEPVDKDYAAMTAGVGE